MRILVIFLLLSGCPLLAEADAVKPKAKAPTAASASQFKIRADVLWHYPPSPQFSLKNTHADLFVDLFPLRGLHLQFEVAPNSRLYEVGWRVHPDIEIRAGRIWIPFDEIGPSRPFGGMITRSEFASPGVTSFLPDLWTDLGVAAHFILSRGETEASDAHVYIVNGFQDGGTDPFQQVNSYPLFGPGGTSNSDNNGDKAIGGRFKICLSRAACYGFSVYSGVYSAGNFDSARATALGLDSQFRVLNRWRLRAGYAVMFVGLIPGSASSSFSRAGAHASIQTTVTDRFKVTVGGAALQMDDRIVNASDRLLVGLTTSYVPQPNIEVSAMLNRDLNQVTAKTNYTAFGLRFFMVY